MTSFSNEKQLRFTVTLAIAKFADGSNQTTIMGLRSVVEVDKGGGQMMCQARIKIYGMDPSVMKAMTTLAWRDLSFTKNTVKIEAVDGDVATTVYEGQIINAWPDFQSAPDVCFAMWTQTGYFDQVKTVTPASFPGPTSVASIYAGIAAKMGVTIENNGVTGQLQSPYFPGSLIDQLRAVSEATRTEYFLDSGVLAVCPNGIARKRPQDLIPLISKATGMKGYPSFDKIGVAFVTLFNPAILFGGQIVMQSEDVSPANGTWQVCSVNHHLESQKPDGAWFSMVRCTGTGLVPK